MSQYPESMAAVETIIGIACIKPPDGLELMKYYVEAFHKVYDNLGKII